MIGGNPRFQPHVAEKTFRSLIFAAHRPVRSLAGSQCTESLIYRITSNTARKSSFSAAS